MSVERAYEKRVKLLGEGTSAFRVVDGLGDGLAGVYVEEFAGRWLVSTLGGEVPVEVLRAAKGRSVYHKRLDQHQKESPRWVAGERVEEVFLAQESGVNFEISFQSGYSQGIFLDQRENRVRVRERVAGRISGGGGVVRLLNTFSYTGVFSVVAALGGAETTTLDLSQPYLEWARRNFGHNGLEAGEHHFCKGDTFHWLERFGRQGREFDAIVLDPPTFSRDERGRVFRVEKDYGDLVALALRCLSADGWLLCCTNCRKVTDGDFARQIRGASRGALLLERTGMAFDFPEMPYLKSVWVQR